jgi:hypothetical protein
MEIRLSGKQFNSPGYKSMSSWIRTTKDKRKVLVIKLGELEISVYPFDRYQIRQLGTKLLEISE